MYRHRILWLSRRICLHNEDCIYAKNSSFVPDKLRQPVCILNKRFSTCSYNISSHNLGIRNMSAEASSSSKKVNRLALEKSPYLLQHASNPIDWYPWGEEAFEKARNENKLIFLSVGYSTCHWCHVMEKESFEDQSVADIMNKYFVSIKVDREERPDVDRLYMGFIQATVGGGGWPMSVFLSPSLEPLTGGTYFPPEDKYGRPGFKTILKSIAEQWKNNQAAMAKSGKTVLDILKKAHSHQHTDANNIPGEDCWKKCLLQISRNYESDFGGFSSSPKFPQPVLFNFLFHVYSRQRDSEQGFRCLEMCLHTLRKMAYGGIHDHVNKGFARYSVDERWHVPHFEKMLYDQAQLVISYCDAYVITKEDFFSDIVKDILTYVSRDLSHETGGFYGAEDADSYPYEGAPHKQEGAFCVWEYDEIFNLLDTKTDDISHAELVAYHYNVKKEGNVKPSQDPHGELTKKNVLACFGSYENTANKFGIEVEKVKEILSKSHDVLYQARQTRPKPHVDTKILTSWNGLMISGFAKAGFALNEESYVKRAVQAAEFIKKYSYNEDKTLTRCCYRDSDNSISLGPAAIPGFLEDYAFLIRGLIDLYEATLDTKWLQWAESLQETQNDKFWDTNDGGYFGSPEGDSSILFRGKEDQDGAEPCGNSVSAQNLVKLSAYLERKDYKERAGNLLKTFSERLHSIPIALPEMASALMLYHESLNQVFIVGPIEDTSTKALLDVVRTHFMPGTILAVADGPSGKSSLLYQRHPILARLESVDHKPAAYVCRNFTCALPVTEPSELASLLERNNAESK